MLICEFILALYDLGFSESSPWALIKKISRMHSRFRPKYDKMITEGI